jgi:hypothetical protein
MADIAYIAGQVVGQGHDRPAEAAQKVSVL